MNILRYHIFLLIVVMSCSGEREDTSSAKESVPTANKNSIVLSQQQASTIKLTTGRIENRNLTNIVKANGYLDVPPQNKAVISPMITGYVRKINFLVGDNVRKGQIMAELESMEFIDLQQEYVELKARIEYLKDDYERQKVLREQDAVSKKKFLMAEIDYKTAIATLDGLRSKLKMLGVNFDKLDTGKIESTILLRAPISGSVKSQDTMVGRHVDPSEEIFEIVNSDHLHLELSVYEKDVIHIKKGQKVWFRIPSLNNHIFEGAVFLVGRDLSEDKRSINVHVHIQEETGFTVGMYANASIVVEDNPTFALPVTAVVVDGNNKYVFRKKKLSDDQLVFERMSVITGLESEGLIEINNMQDFSVDDEIVIDGAFYLLNAFEEGSSTP